MDRVLIRAAWLEDLPTILALLSESQLPTAGVREHIETFVVATEGERIAGVTGLEVYGDVALLRSVVVAPDFRGRGLGDMLMKFALSWARQQGIRQVALLTTSAAGFFRRFGFEEVDRHRLDHRLLASEEFAAPHCATATAMMLDIRRHGPEV